MGKKPVYIYNRRNSTLRTGETGFRCGFPGKRRPAAAVYAALFVVLLTPRLPIVAQNVTSPAFKEKRPTTRDPGYRAPNIPPQLRDQLDLSPEDPGSLILNPKGDISIDTYTRLMDKKEEEKRQADSIRWQRDVRNIPGGQERVILEKSLLRQFGADDFPHEWRKDAHYEESSFRRFQITFFLSLPITMGAAYALGSGLKSSSGGSPTVFTGPETAAMVLTGLGASAWIGWYDLSEWKKLKVEKVSANDYREEDGPKEADHPASIKAAHIATLAQIARKRNESSVDPYDIYHATGSEPEFRLGWTWAIP